MGFGLAEGYVELSAKGFKGTETAIGSVTAKLRELTKVDLGGIGKAADGVTGHFQSMLSPLGLVSQGLAALGLSIGLGGMVAMAAETQRTKATLDQLTGSAQKTDDMMARLKKQFSGTTIDRAQYMAVAQDMLAEGKSSEFVLETTRKLGNISLATGESLEGMARAYDKAETSGKVSMRTLMAMQPVVTELGRMYGLSEEQVVQYAESGRIGITQLQAAIDNLGGEQGKFGNMMAAQQQTLAGQWDILKGNITGSLGEIGLSIIQTFDLQTVTANLAGWVSWFRTEYGDTIRQMFQDIRNTAMEFFDFLVEHKGLVTLVAQIAGGFVAVRVASTALALALNVLGPGLSILKFLASTIIPIVYGLGTALMFLCTNPIGLTILALAGLAAAIYGVLAYFGMTGPIDEFANRIIRKVKEATGAMSGMKSDVGAAAEGTGTWERSAQDGHMFRTDLGLKLKTSKEKEKEMEGRNAMIRPAAPGLAPGLNPGKDEAKVSFTSLSGLAEKMQQEAGKEDLQAQQLAAQQQAANNLDKVAGAVDGNALNVNIKPQTFPPFKLS